MEPEVNRKWLMIVWAMLCLFLDGSITLAGQAMFFSNLNHIVSQLILLAVVMITYEVPQQKYLIWWFLALGLLYDLYFVGMVGLYTIALPAIYTLAVFFRHNFEPIWYNKLSVFILSVTFTQIYVYVMSVFFRLTSVSLGTFFIDALAPTIILNLVLFPLFFWVGNLLLKNMYRHNRGGK